MWSLSVAVVVGLALLANCEREQQSVAFNEHLLNAERVNKNEKFCVVKERGEEGGDRFKYGVQFNFCTGKPGNCCSNVRCKPVNLMGLQEGNVGRLLKKMITPKVTSDEKSCTCRMKTDVTKPGNGELIVSFRLHQSTHTVKCDVGTCWSQYSEASRVANKKKLESYSHAGLYLADLHHWEAECEEGEGSSNVPGVSDLRENIKTDPSFGTEGERDAALQQLEQFLPEDEGDIEEETVSSEARDGSGDELPNGAEVDPTHAFGDWEYEDHEGKTQEFTISEPAASPGWHFTEDDTDGTLSPDNEGWHSGSLGVKTVRQNATGAIHEEYDVKGVIRVKLTDESTMLTQFKPEGETEWDAEGEAWKKTEDTEETTLDAQEEQVPEDKLEDEPATTVEDNMPSAPEHEPEAEQVKDLEPPPDMDTEEIEDSDENKVLASMAKPDAAPTAACGQDLQAWGEAHVQDHFNVAAEAADGPAMTAEEVDRAISSICMLARDPPANVPDGEAHYCCAINAAMYAFMKKDEGVKLKDTSSAKAREVEYTQFVCELVSGVCQGVRQQM